MLGEEMLEPVITSGIDQVLEVSATKIMGEMFGVETVESVKEVSSEFSRFVLDISERVNSGFLSNISAEQLTSALTAGGIGAIAGFSLGLALTIYMEKCEEKITGHKPVPRLGIGCSTIPSATFYGAVGGFVGKLIFP